MRLRPTRTATLLFLLVGLLGAGTSGCGDGRTPLMLYSPHGPDLLGLVEDRFEALHPEVDVRWLDMGSQDVFDRIRSEAANPQADVWFGGPDTILARGADEGLLQPYRPAWADSVPPECQGRDDLFFALYRTTPVLVYNEDAVSEAEAPRDWEDLLDPRWRDQILIRDPLASGTMRTLFELVLARSVAETGSPDAGFEFLLRLDAQTREYVQNPALMIEKLTRKEGVLTVWELTDIHWRRKRGRPLGFSFSASGNPVINDAVGLVRGAPQDEWGRRFIDWAGSVEAQTMAAEEAFRLPARSDLPREALPAWAQKVLAELRPAPLDRELMASRGQEWMARWDREVRSRGRQNGY